MPQISQSSPICVSKILKLFEYLYQGAALVRSIQHIRSLRPQKCSRCPKMYLKFQEIFRVHYDHMTSKVYQMFNRLSSHATNKGKKGKITDFHESWPDWSTRGWGWPCKVFWTWGHPNRFWESTLIVDLHLNTNFSLPQPNFFYCSPFDFWCAWKIFTKYGNCQPINVRFRNKKGPKNCSILMKFCVHIVQTSGYHHKKFH